MRKNTKSKIKGSRKERERKKKRKKKKEKRCLPRPPAAGTVSSVKSGARGMDYGPSFLRLVPSLV